MAMKCKCGEELQSKSTRTLENNQIRRTKVCPKCKARYPTIEILVDDYNDMASFFNGFIQLIEKYAHPQK